MLVCILLYIEFWIKMFQAYQMIVKRRRYDCTYSSVGFVFCDSTIVIILRFWDVVFGTNGLHGFAL